MTAVGRQPFDGCDLLAAHRPDGRLTRAHSLPVQMHRTGAAQPHATAKLGAGESQRVAQDPQQRCFGSDLDLTWLSIDDEAYLSHCESPPSSKVDLTINKKPLREEVFWDESSMGRAES